MREENVDEGDETVLEKSPRATSSMRIRGSLLE